ncbi:MAG: ribosome-associated translation inhibitor RaiA [Alphaproteobacteria bacterium]|nr:ribosome-associated translation inhibitor RaiA [Alphaproteobacteria bacterium]
MNLTVKGKQIDIGDALREHVHSNISSICNKYFIDPIEASVTFSREAYLIKVQISVHIGKGILLQAEDNADLPYPAFDLAVQHLIKRLQKYKKRLKDHQRKSVDSFAVQHYVLAPEPDLEEHHDQNNISHPTIVAEMETDIATLTVSEAVMRLDLADLNAMMFRNRSHGGLNMVYRRLDGHIGWIDPQNKELLNQK